MNSGIYNMDCMEAMKEFPDNFFSLAIVDPPYGLGMGGTLNVNSKTNYKFKKWDTDLPTKEYFIELQRVSVNQIIWGWNYFADLLPPCKGFIYWNKLNHHPNRSSGELAYCSIGGLAKHFEYMWDGNRYGFKEQKVEGVGKPSIRIHPTQKPIKLYEWLLMNYAKEGDKILDTHMGSGSSVIACNRLGFDVWAYEIDKDYFEAAKKRIELEKTKLTLNL